MRMRTWPWMIWWLSMAPASAAEPAAPAAPAAPDVGARDDPWLVRTVLGAYWPMSFERVRVSGQGEELALIVDGYDMKAKKTFRWRLPLAGERPYRPKVLDAPAKRSNALVPEAVSPDGKHRGRAQDGENIVLTVAHTASGEEDTVLRQAYTGDWSIGHLAWSADSSALFFDNGGAVACIWRYDLKTRALSKIVPEHEARGPAVFVQDGVEQLAFYQSPWEKTPMVKIARPLSKAQKTDLERRQAGLEPVADTWYELNKEGAERVIRARCDGSFHTLRLIREKGAPARMVVGPPGDAYELEADAAVRTGEGTYSVVACTPAGGLLELAEIRFLDKQRSRARIVQLAEGRGPIVREYIRHAYRGEVKTIQPDCSEEHYAD
ncbi:MAG: hypothetical protein JXR96_15180 [Deltaproteobacteria bacterium]|nr:hypothetical protein [Deltaproteobacteria bacterium]